VIAELGQLSLAFALALSLVMANAGLVGAGAANGTARRIAGGATMGLMVFCLLAFGALTQAYLVSDFSLETVAGNSTTTQPLFYKIAAVWSNHEGSMLLWMLVLALYSGAIAMLGRGGERLTSAALGIMGLLSAAFLLFILFTSSPFTRIDPPMFEGMGLNPLLQDPGAVMHPPMLYLGYVGLSAAFAYAAAALIVGDAVESNGWAGAARPFMLMAWITLTCGIALGSWWAYYTLGWGGFWFWDAVENASLMPWLVATALLHSALATEQRGAFRTWTLLLAITGFSMSLIGTFLVRSGVLSSVHSFASDPTRGFFILILIGLAIGGALGLFAWRAPKLQGGVPFQLVSRETTLLLNNVLLMVALTVVFIGTIYPLALDALTGRKITVGGPFFAIFFAPLFVALMVLVPFGPRLSWRNADLKAAARTLYPALGVALVAGITALAIASPRSAAGIGSFAVAGWLIGASVIEFIKRRGARAAAFAAAIAHAGLGVSLMGVAGTVVWRSEALVVVGKGETLSVGPYTLRFDGVIERDGPNFAGRQAQVALLDGDQVKAVMRPEQRIYTASGQDVSVTAIRTTGLRDLYLALGDNRGNGRWTLRAYVSPLAPLIWIGGLVMALGGIISLFARLTARAPRKQASPTVAVAAE
jgi:cytochrome c-type biogenesis protein CcmF